MAEAILDANGGKPPKGSTKPPLVGWTSEVQSLAEVTDLLRAQIHQTAGDDKFKPSPRPEMALDVVLRERKDKKISEIEARLTGKG